MKSDRTASESGFLGGPWRSRVLVAALGLLVYAWSISFGFTHCDDDRIIVTEHEKIRDLSRVPDAFADSFGGLYRPVLQVSFIVDALRGGTDPGAYHLSNVIYHLAASLLVLAVLRRLLGPGRMALFLALLFTCHPLLVQAVAWIPGRNDLLVTIFVLLSFLSLASLVERGRPLLYAAHFTTFGLALFSKESAAFFPLLCLFYIVVLRKEGLLTRRTLVLTAGWAGLGIVWLVARFSASDILSHPNEVGIAAFLKSWPALPALLGKLILPVKLSGLATFDPISIGAGALLAAAVAVLAVVAKSADRKRLLFGLAWYLLFLLPTLFYRVKGADDHYDYLEHRAYLPMLGLLIVAGELLPRLGVTLRRRPALIAAAALLALLSAGAIAHSLSFRDARSFWTAAVANDPGRANFHSVLGELRFRENDLAGAEVCFLEAKKLTVTNDPFIHFNLGVVYRGMKESGKAIAALEKAIAVDPENPLFVFTLGKTFYDGDRLEEALARFERTIALEPRYQKAYLFLIGIHDKAGRTDEAIEACRAYHEAAPRSAQPLHFLVELYTKKGSPDGVAGAREKILALEPGNQELRLWLAQYYRERGDSSAAQRHEVEYMKRGGRLPAR